MLKVREYSFRRICDKCTNWRRATIVDKFISVAIMTSNRWKNARSFDGSVDTSYRTRTLGFRRWRSSTEASARYWPRLVGWANLRFKHTFLPMCSSVTKNWEATSAWVTLSASKTVKDPMPARTRFFAISLPSAPIVTRRIFALRIRFWASMPQRRSCRSYSAISSAERPSVAAAIVASVIESLEFLAGMRWSARNIDQWNRILCGAPLWGPF